MDKLIPKLYQTYGMYVNHSRAFPLDIDGLKPVERRVLLSTYLMARDKFAKSARIDGTCLTGDTLIKLADGRKKSIEELYNENFSNFYIFAFDIKSKKPVITYAENVVLTKHVTKIIKIVTESGEVRCTEDHLWLTKTGEYKQAKDLKIDDELETMEFGITDKHSLFKKHWTGIGYYEAIDYNGNYYLSHHLADEYNCRNGLEELNELTSNFHRHHVDMNKLNNNPENIKRLKPQDHMSIHMTDWLYNKGGLEVLSKHGKEIQKNHPEITENLVNWTKNKLLQDPDWARDCCMKFWHNLTNEERKEFGLKVSEGIKKYYKENGTDKLSIIATDYWNQDTESVSIHREKNRQAGIRTSKNNFPNNHKVKILKTLKIILDTKLELNKENYNSSRPSRAYPLYDKILSYFNSYDEALEEAKNYKNHTVLNIEEIIFDEPIPVYDIINSKDFNNFIVMFDDNTCLISHNCLGKFHPHSSSYGTMCQLVNQGFLDGQGNFGNNIGIEESPPAAMRYTECKLNRQILDIALRLIDYVNWVPSELDDEPEYFPTMFPLCLLGKEYTTGIGFGYKALIPCYTIGDLKNRLLFLLGKIKDKPTIKPITNCNILSVEKDFEDLLTTGKGKITYQGFFKADNARCKYVIKSFPPGKKFETILGKFEKELNNQDIGWIDESSAENGGTHIVFEVLKSRNRDEIFKSFSKKLTNELTSSLTFDTIVVDSATRNTKTMSIDEMLINTFKTYMTINMKMLKVNEVKLNDVILEVTLLEKVKPSLAKYLKNKDFSVDEIIEKISVEVNEDKSKIKELFQKYRITKLLTFKADYDELNEKLKVIKDNITNIGEFVVGQYESL